MTNPVKIFILHHIPAAERKKQLEQDLKNIKITYPIDWITGFLPEEIKHYTKNIKESELSLSLKHKYVFEKIIQNNIEYGIVFEDDVDLKSIENLEDFLQKGINDIKSVQGDLLWLGNINKWNLYHISANEKQKDKISFFSSKCLSRCTHAFIVSKQAAIKILQNFHYNLPIDHLLNEIILNQKLISGWTEPWLLQKSAEGSWPTYIS